MDHAALTPQRLPARGQSALEFVLTLVASLILLFGTLKVFAWVNSGMVQREVNYQQSRMAAGNINTPGTPNPYQLPKLGILGPGGASSRRPVRPAPGTTQCDAAKQLMDEADALVAEADALLALVQETKAPQAQQLMVDADALLAEAEQLRSEADQLERDAMDAESRGDYAEAQRLRDEAQAKRQLADQKEQEARQKQLAAQNLSQEIARDAQEANDKYQVAQCLYRIAADRQAVCDGLRRSDEPIDDPASCRNAPPGDF